MVFVECTRDVNFVRALGVQRAKIVHAGGKGEVIKRIDRWLRKYPGSPVAGLVDEDPGTKPPAGFNSYRQHRSEPGYAVYEHNQHQAQLVVLRPRLEEWLYARAKECGLEPSSFGLPPKAGELHSLPPRARAECFERFVQALLAKDSAVQGVKQVLERC